MAVEIPTVGAQRPPKLPKVEERTLGNGLGALAVRKSGVPRFELRLRVALARARDAGDPARQRLMSETLLSGTSDRSSVEIARYLQSLGASANVGADAEHLVISASGLVGSLQKVLDLVAQVITDAEYPAHEVELQRGRIAQEVTIARSQPQTIAVESFLGRLYGDHPYARVLPEAADLEQLERKDLRAFHRQRLVPGAAHAVLVGDLAPGKALDAIESALGSWSGKGKVGKIPAPTTPEPGAILLIDRPGAVQTNIRIGTIAIDRRDPGFPALAAVNTVFGGYFSSRLVDNIRERRGYTYSPNSGINQNLSASHLMVGADVATEVTAPALVEIAYELGRVAALPVEPDELESAKRYMQGSLAISTQTQAGLATYLNTIGPMGLGIEFLREYPLAVQRVTVAEAHEAARRHLAPGRMHTVLVGDASVISEQVSALGKLEVR